MNWIVVLVVVMLLALALKMRTASSLSLETVETVREQLKNGACLVDVRTVAEYNTKHLTRAVNIPLDRLKLEFPHRVPDRSRFVLLHCLSGARSGTAETQLRVLGYTNVPNLGSYDQAERAVNGGSN